MRMRYSSVVEGSKKKCVHLTREEGENNHTKPSFPTASPFSGKNTYFSDEKGFRLFVCTREKGKIFKNWAFNWI